MRIVAIDFETANTNLASACSLGVTIYNEGEIIDNFEWLLKPNEKYFYFTNSHIHGIYEEDVINESEFVFYYDELAAILKDSVIVAHNANFDICVLNALCDLYGLDRFKNDYLDTVKISRLVYPELINHKLDTVARYLDFNFNHHNAKSDSYACLMILLKAMEAYKTYELDDFMSKIGIHFTKNM